MHYRLAESQFYRLLSPGCPAKVTSVEYVVSPKVARAFEEAKKRIDGVNKPVLAFHGTADANIRPITETGFRMPGVGGHKHATDTGWYGKGVYFSEYPDYSMGYIKGSTRLLLCQVLLGRVYKCTKLIHGAPLQTGYSSHASPDGRELVIFSTHHILPCYIVNFSNKGFTYAPEADALLAVTSSDPLTKSVAAGMETALAKAKSSKALTGCAFILAGKYAIKQDALKQLIKLHGGTVLPPTVTPAAAEKTAKAGAHVLLVCSEKDWEMTKGGEVCATASRYAAELTVGS